VTTLHFRGRLLPGVAMFVLAACSNNPQPTPEPSSSANVAASSAIAPDAATTDAPISPPSLGADVPPVKETTVAAIAPTPNPRPSASSAAGTVVAEAAPAPARAVVAGKLAVAVTPPASWTRCSVCHAAEKGASAKLGPNLYGIFGQKMGQGSYAYSDALKASGLTMDESTLDKWLENPRALVPGNRMSFPGLKDPAKRAEIIVYLKQQR